MFERLFLVVLLASGATACSDPVAAAADAAPDAAQDSAADASSDSGAATGADVDKSQWQMPELDPALCTPDPGLDWLGAGAGYGLVSSGAGTMAAVQDKNWYLLTLLQQPAYRAILGKDPALAALNQKRSADLQTAVQQCGAVPACLGALLGMTAAERKAAVQLSVSALQASDLVAKHLRPSGQWSLHAGKADAELLGVALATTLDELARNYQQAEANRVDLPGAVTAVAAAHLAPALYFEPLLWLTLDGLAWQKHDEAGRYEPLAAGENAAALSALATADWAAWRFGAILVPGWGPLDLQTPLSETGRDHCDLAALRWKAKVAPFILLSGGHVHPEQTPYAEALEMKQYLMQAHQIPASALLVDPHARHTTTNVRNAARMLLRAGVPASKPLLVTTDLLQAFYIVHLTSRCLEELGYVPFRTMISLTTEDNCWLPAVASLHADPRDERDP